MRTTIPALVIAGFLLAGCSTNANPMNWFDSDPPDARVLEPIEKTNPLIPESTGIFDSRRREARYEGTPVDTVSDLTIERFPGGVIIRATGQSGALIPYDARLTPANEDEVPEDGVLTYRLEALYAQPSVQSPQAQQVTVARQLTIQELGETRVIRVEGVQNALDRRR